MVSKTKFKLLASPSSISIGIVAKSKKVMPARLSLSIKNLAGQIQFQSPMISLVMEMLSTMRKEE
jgi:hypothetical protein